MSTTTHKVAAILSMAVAALALALSVSTAPHSSVAGGTNAATPSSVADLDW